jgi:hypothetical protein
MKNQSSGFLLQPRSQKEVKKVNWVSYETQAESLSRGAQCKKRLLRATFSLSKIVTTKNLSLGNLAFSLLPIQYQYLTPKQKLDKNAL